MTQLLWPQRWISAIQVQGTLKSIAKLPNHPLPWSFSTQIPALQAVLTSPPGCASGHHPSASSGAGGGSHWPGGVPRTCCTRSRGQPVPGQPWACPKPAPELPELLWLHQRAVGEPRHLWGEVAASFFLSFFFFPLIFIWDVAL